MNKDLTVGSPKKVLFLFCLPLLGSMVFQQLYNLADSFVAGKFISENALAAVGNSYEITLVFIAFAFGCNIGCSVVVGQFFGAKKIRRACSRNGVILNPFYIYAFLFCVRRLRKLTLSLCDVNNRQYAVFDKKFNFLSAESKTVNPAVALIRRTRVKG